MKIPGLAYDLKTASEEIIKKRIQRTGDGSHPKVCRKEKDESSEDVMVWGWDDKDMDESEKKLATKI